MSSASVSSLERLTKWLSAAIVGLVIYGVANFASLEGVIDKNPLANLATGEDVVYRNELKSDKREQDVLDKKDQTFVADKYTTQGGVAVVVTDYKYLNMAMALRNCDNYGDGIRPEQYQSFQSKLERYCQPDATGKDVERCKQGLDAIKKLCPSPKSDFNLNFFGLG